MPCEALGISFLFEDLRVAPSPTRHDCGKARAGDLDRVVIDFRPWEVTFTLTHETIKFCSPISELISLTRELACRWLAQRALRPMNECVAEASASESWGRSIFSVDLSRRSLAPSLIGGALSLHICHSCAAKALRALCIKILAACGSCKLNLHWASTPTSGDQIPYPSLINGGV
jgi:hypothetical protein